MGFSILPALVLGAGVTGSGDANNIHNGFHLCMDNVTNIPTQYGMLLSSATGDQMRAQLFFSTTGSLFRRKYSNNSWTNWFTMYDENILTNSTLLSPLASALGGLPSYSGGTSAEKTTPGIFYTTDIGFVIVFNHSAYPNIAWQFNPSWQNNVSLKMRRTTNGGTTWSEWSTIV